MDKEAGVRPRDACAGVQDSRDRIEVLAERQSVAFRQPLQRSQEVRVLAQGMHHPGRYRVVWGGTDEAGRSVASGVYVYRLEVKGREMVETKRMALVR